MDRRTTEMEGKKKKNQIETGFESPANNAIQVEILKEQKKNKNIILYSNIVKRRCTRACTVDIIEDWEINAKLNVMNTRK